MTILLIISILGLTGMLTLKAFEKRRETRTPIAGIVAKGDRLVEKYANAGARFLDRNKRAIDYFVGGGAAYHMRKGVVKAKFLAQEKSERLKSALQGKKKLLNKGSVSFFLKNISDGKPSNDR